LKKVLILAYYFPPLGMGGTQRTAKFVKYLPQFGWQPVVVTVKDVVYHAIDPSLLDDVKSAIVVRTGSLDPQRLLAIFFPKPEAARSKKSTSPLWRVLNKLISWCFIPDSKLLWLPFVVLKACQLIRRHQIDCILTTSPPHSVHLAGILLKKITGVPLVVDFRDGWSGGNFQTEPARLHRWLNRVLEKCVLNSADAVIAVSQKLNEQLQQKPRRPARKFFTVTNGFDADDFPETTYAEPLTKFTITYCGALTDIAPLDGFFAGLSRFLKTRPEARTEVAVKLVGQNLLENFETRLRELQVFNLIEWTGYLPHRNALMHLRQSHLLLYPVADWASEDFIPGKTFEYLAAGVPVLALGPRVEGVELLEKHGLVQLCAHNDPEAIARMLEKHFDLLKSATFQKKRGDIKQFDRGFLTRRLAEILESKTSSF